MWQRGDRKAANLTAKYSSAYNTGSDLIPYKRQDAFTLVNGRISIGPQKRRWTVDIRGQNLTNEVYKQVVINAPLQGQGFPSTVQSNGTYFNPSLDSNAYVEPFPDVQWLT